MSDLRSRIKNHGVFAELENGRRAVDKALEETTATTIKEDLDRLKAIIEFARWVLDQSDPLYLSPQILEDIRVHAKGVRGEVNNYSSNKNATHIQSANEKCDLVIPFLRGLPIPIREIGVDQYVSTFEEFRRTVYGYLDESSKKVGELTVAVERAQQNAAAVDKDIGQQKLRLDSAIAEFQRQFSEAQGEKQSEFSKAEKSRSDAGSDLLRQMEEVHKNSFEARQSQFEQWFSTADLQANEQRKDHDLRANAELDRISKLRSQAEKIVGLIGEHGMVHGYQTQANEARSAFRLWSGTAVGALLVWIAIGLLAFWFTLDRELTWSIVARQFLVSTPFLLLATFAGYQAFVQQRSATRFRRRELEIASLDPFLSSLSRDETNEVKKQMVSKFFGHSDNDDAPPPPDLAAIFTSVASQLRGNGEKKQS